MKEWFKFFSLTLVFLSLFFLLLFFFLNAFLGRCCELYCVERRGTSYWRYNFLNCECGEITREGVIRWVSIWRSFP